MEAESFGSRARPRKGGSITVGRAEVALQFRAGEFAPEGDRVIREKIVFLKKVLRGWRGIVV